MSDGPVLNAICKIDFDKMKQNNLSHNYIYLLNQQKVHALFGQINRLGTQTYFCVVFFCTLERSMYSLVKYISTGNYICSKLVYALYTHLSVTTNIKLF